MTGQSLAASGHSCWPPTTAFVEVPWDGPYYQRLGFVPIPENELTPGLAPARQQESAAGLDRWAPNGHVLQGPQRRRDSTLRLRVPQPPPPSPSAIHRSDASN